jgi:hypothetical protein
MTSCMLDENMSALKCIRTHLGAHELCSQTVQAPIRAPGARPAHRCLASCASLTTSSECRVSFAGKTRRQERHASRYAHAPRAIVYTAGHFHQTGRPQQGATCQPTLRRKSNGDEWRRHAPVRMLARVTITVAAVTVAAAIERCLGTTWRGAIPTASPAGLSRSQSWCWADRADAAPPQSSDRLT